MNTFVLLAADLYLVAAMIGIALDTRNVRPVIVDLNNLGAAQIATLTSRWSAM